MNEIITLDYGSGGKKTASLIENMILPALDNEALDALLDGAVLPGAEKIVFSTDSFVISPLFFPGGDIGKLAVCGTVNDVAMAGGSARYLSLAFIIEEGFEIEKLKKIIDSIQKTANDAGVAVVTGDTKVVEKGKCDGIYINTSGIGVLRAPGLSPAAIKEGDKIIVSGTMGDHGTSILLSRYGYAGGEEVKSDCACLKRLAGGLYDLSGDLRVLRDPTRGGLATTLCEFVENTDLCICLDESRIPISKNVKSACEMLGLDPLYSANEGKLIAVVSPNAADRALSIIRSYPEGENAAIIGTVTKDHPGQTVLRTAFGGSRILTKLTGAQLPRIC